jgi:hypothetical protein
MSQSAGSALVVLASLGFVDREGDLVLPASLAIGRAVVSRHGHSVILDGEEPVGEARLFERDGRLWAEITYYPDEDNG